jgi:membrane protein YqaA with SNARE-associated domain
VSVAAWLTLFGWSFLAATILPLGSEPALAAMVLRGHSIVAAVAVATAGNYLGACTTYWIGRRAGDVLSSHNDRASRSHRAASLIRRFGQPAMLLSWVPLIGDALVAAAGAVRMPFWPFSVWCIVGKALRYAAVAWGADAVRG